MTTENDQSTQQARSSASAGSPNFDLEPRADSTVALARSGVGGVLCATTDLVRFEREFVAGRASGVTRICTGAGLKMVVATGEPERVQGYLLNEMGILADVCCLNESLLIGVRTHHAFAEVMRVLRGSFVVVAAMTESGRQAIQVLPKGGAK